MFDSTQKVVALEARLRSCPNVITLGVRPNFMDYSESEHDLIREAACIYYPSAFYADILTAMGKRIFPSLHSYLYAQDKVKQTALFQTAGIPHPNTRVFYGLRQRQKILDYFQFPFIGKIPRGSAMGRGVFLIENQTDLDRYLHQTDIAYIQVYIPGDRDIRVVVIGDEIICAYWRIADTNDFRSNISCGGTVGLGPVPEAALELALNTARICNWNDVGVDIRPDKNRFLVIEANMKYGREGFRKKGIDYFKTMESLIADGKI